MLGDKKRRIRWGLRGASDERGQAVLETALVSVVLLLLFAGAVDVGRMFYHYINITNAAREGARAAVRQPCDGLTTSEAIEGIERRYLPGARDGIASGLIHRRGDIEITPATGGCLSRRNSGPSNRLILH